MKRTTKDYIKRLEIRIDWLRLHLKQPEHFVDNGARCRVELTILRTVVNDLAEIGEELGGDTYWKDIRDC